MSDNVVFKAEVRKALSNLVAEEVRRLLPVMLLEAVTGSSKAGAYPSHGSVAADAPKRRGRRPQFTAEERRAKAAAYQRMYRAKKAAKV